MQIEKSTLLYSELTENILRVYYDVYNEIGHGFLELVYANCMAIALAEAGLDVQREIPIPVWFRKQQVGQFRADLLVNQLVLLELEALPNLERSNEAQLLNYLRATELEVGLILNFGGSKPQFRRLVFENERKAIRAHPRASAAGGSGIS